MNALDSAGMTPLCVARSQKIRELMRCKFSTIIHDRIVNLNSSRQCNLIRKWKHLPEQVIITGKGVQIFLSYKHLAC